MLGLKHLSPEAFPHWSGDGMTKAAKGIQHFQSDKCGILGSPVAAGTGGFPSMIEGGGESWKNS